MSIKFKNKNKKNFIYKKYKSNFIKLIKKLNKIFIKIIKI